MVNISYYYTVGIITICISIIGYLLINSQITNDIQWSNHPTYLLLPEWMNHSQRNGVEQKAPSSFLLWEIASAYYKTEALNVAIALKLPSLLLAGCKTSEEISQITHTHKLSLFRLLRYLVGIKFFISKTTVEHDIDSTKSTECFQNTDVSLLLASTSKDDDIMNGVLAIIKGHRRGWSGLLKSIRTGDSGYEKETGISFESYLLNESAHSQSRCSLKLLGNHNITSIILKLDAINHATRVIEIGGMNVVMAILKVYSNKQVVIFDYTNVFQSQKFKKIEQNHINNNKNKNSLQAIHINDDSDMLLKLSKMINNNDDAFVVIFDNILRNYNRADTIKYLRNLHRAISLNTTIYIVDQIISSDLNHIISQYNSGIDLDSLVTRGGSDKTMEQWLDILYMTNYILVQVSTLPPGIMTIFQVIKKI